MKIIFKKNFSTVAHEIQVKSEDNGKDLRVRLAEKEGVTPDEVQLKYWGDVIQDDVTVSDYKMKEDDQIIFQINKAAKKMKTDGSAEEAVAAPQFITLTLKQEGEADLQVETVPEDSIAILRVKIEQKHGIPASAIKIKNKNGMIMFPAKRLIDYEIDSDIAVVMLVDKNIAATAKAQPTQAMDQEAKGSVTVKVKFHDGEVKEITADYDDTIEALRQKLLTAKPFEKDQESTHRLKIVVGDAEKGDKVQLKELGQKGTISVTAALERTKGENDLQFTVKRSVGADSAKIIINKDTKVSDLKKMLEEQFKATASEIILKHGLKDLTDSDSLSTYAIPDDAVITLSVFKKGLFSN